MTFLSSRSRPRFALRRSPWGERCGVGHCARGVTHVASRFVALQKPLSIVSGISDLIVLKTTGSGFVGYIQCALLLVVVLCSGCHCACSLLLGLACVRVFYRDKLTTLPPTTGEQPNRVWNRLTDGVVPLVPSLADRLMSTAARITWTYCSKALQRGGIDFCKTHDGESTVLGLATVLTVHEEPGRRAELVLGRVCQ